MSERAAWRDDLYRIIFGHDTVDGRRFDVVLIVAIVVSVVAVMLDTVPTVRAEWAAELYAVEWGFTVLFTVEYLLRLICHPRPTSYVFSFFGVIDVLAILPTYISVLVPGSQYLLVVRLLRVLRVYRVMKLVQYLGEADALMTALRESRRKITVFLLAVTVIAIITGSLMYMVEGPPNGFTSIPISVYWAIVTLTTVGYGDISPQTPFGQGLAAFIMMLGYAIIAVPTGIVTVELSRLGRGGRPRACPDCGESGHDADAAFCKHCGTRLGTHVREERG